ncbi:MAG TPA: biopolymer transporter ExbB [Flavobacteriales bacterium]|jgi:biopolymer transport protein ExbB|nr:biopolymer transporter ExbB [Flavobacteriales bacterium]
MNGLFLQITTTADSTEVIPREETLSVFELIQGGGWYIMIPLLILSIAAVYIFIERYLAISRVAKASTSFMKDVRDHVYKGEIEAARKACKNANNPYSRMIEKGLMRVGKPMPDISLAIENEGKLEITKLEKSLSFEATIAGAAPMIGFLGTVIGMMAAFHEMNTSGNSVELNQLAGGIMQAMVTTAAGLVIGIVAYLGYNILVGRIDRVAFRMDELSVEFIDMLQEPA